MAKLVFAMNQSLDGYVDHLGFAPGPTLLRHFIEQTRLLAGSVYGRCIYEVMRYWDDDHPEWDDDEFEELGYSLNQIIKGKINKRHRDTQRLLYMQMVRLKAIRFFIDQ